MTKAEKLQTAISRIAELFEYGSLLADTDPVGFFDLLTDEIKSLRADNKKLRAIIDNGLGEDDFRD